jgi:hypothetical protein
MYSFWKIKLKYYKVSSELYIKIKADGVGGALILQTFFYTQLMTRISPNNNSTQYNAKGDS